MSHLAWFAIGLALVLALAAMVLAILAMRKLLRRSRRQDIADAVGNDVAELMAQLDGLARRIDTTVESRLSRLQKLIDVADARTAALGRYDAQGPSQNQPPRPSQESPQRSVKILQLKNQGMDIVEIAKQLDMNVGEVELVLNLKRCGEQA
ncbi:MAG: hypothetical protein KAU28_02675 [Phycisphaerae bacterium]|nr:hypothetical protein [Phycisphaerae bacterium]